MNNTDLRNDVAGLIRQFKAHFGHIENPEEITAEVAASLLVEVEALGKKLVVLNFLDSAVADKVGQAEVPVLDSLQSESVEMPTNAVITEVLPVEEVLPAVVDPVEEEHLPVEEARVVADLKEEAVVVAPAEIKSEPVIEEDNSAVKNIPKVQLADIKAGIGINDKFQFIAELFGGSGDKYEESVKQLNTFETLDASLFYMDEIRSRFQWKEDSGTVQRLTELVKRRFL